MEILPLACIYLQCVVATWSSLAQFLDRLGLLPVQLLPVKGAPTLMQHGQGAKQWIHVETLETAAKLATLRYASTTAAEMIEAVGVGQVRVSSGQGQQVHGHHASLRLPQGLPLRILQACGRRGHDVAAVSVYPSQTAG